MNYPFLIGDSDLFLNKFEKHSAPKAPFLTLEHRCAIELIHNKIGRTDAYNSSIELDGIQKVVFEIIIQCTI